MNSTIRRVGVEQVSEVLRIMQSAFESIAADLCRRAGR
jgi:hypothetical protein